MSAVVEPLTYPLNQSTIDEKDLFIVADENNIPTPPSTSLTESTNFQIFNHHHHHQQQQQQKQSAAVYSIAKQYQQQQTIFQNSQYNPYNGFGNGAHQSPNTLMQQNATGMIHPERPPMQSFQQQQLKRVNYGTHICTLYQQGNCHYGCNCRFSHNNTNINDSQRNFKFVGKSNFNSQLNANAKPFEFSHSNHNQFGYNQSSNYSSFYDQNKFETTQYGKAAAATAGPSAFTNKPTAGIHVPSLQKNAERETELFSMENHTLAGIRFEDYSHIPVEVTGNDVHPAVDDFELFPFPDVLMSNIRLANYKLPTPIQKNAIPNALQGRDILACAQTGSGKTAAYLFPLIAHLLNNGIGCGNQHRPIGFGRFKKYAPYGLILAPTRELALQIHTETVKFSYATTLHPCAIYGGADARNQLRELDLGVEILVATPGRLNDMLTRGRITLQSINYLVMDEADRMLDMGFEPQIRTIVQNSDMSMQRQTLLFSATFPTEVQRLAADFLFQYIFIAIGRVGAATDTVTQQCLWVEEENKLTELMRVLPKCIGSTLIFVERKKSAEQLEQWLQRQNIRSVSIHGDRSQDQREASLQLFKTGKCSVCVATDVASRGLDISCVQTVINYDMANNISDYVHRIGRTGRAGNLGNSTTFLNEKNHHVFKDLYNLLVESKQEVPQWLQQQQMVKMQQRSGNSNRVRYNKYYMTRDFRSKDQYGDNKSFRPRPNGNHWSQGSQMNKYQLNPSYGTDQNQRFSSQQRQLNNRQQNNGPSNSNFGQPLQQQQQPW